MRHEREQCSAQADIDYIAAESRLAVPDKEAESVESAAEQAVPFASKHHIQINNYAHKILLIPSNHFLLLFQLRPAK